MRRHWTTLLLLILPLGNSVAQSLGEAARKEAERRRQLEKQGVGERILSSEGLRRIQNETSAGSSPLKGERTRTIREPRAVVRPSANPYRPALRKLDQQIRQCEDRLMVLRQRHEAERRAMAKSGRLANSESANIVRERLFWQLQEMESKLKRLKQERLETYDAGRKAGFLPGELDGHGIVP